MTRRMLSDQENVSFVISYLFVQGSALELPGFYCPPQIVLHPCLSSTSLLAYSLLEVQNLSVHLSHHCNEIPRLILATTRFAGSQLGNNVYNSDISHFTLICLHLISPASLI